MNRHFVIVALIACFAAGAVSAAPIAKDGDQPGFFLDAGWGHAQFDFRDLPDASFARDFADVEVGLFRPVRRGSRFRIGSGLGLLVTLDRPLHDSYSLLCLDALMADYSFGFLQARAGLGLLRAWAPVNEITMGVTFAAAVDLGPLAIGIKSRLARFEVDFEPHGHYPDTKYTVSYIGGFVSPRLHRSGAAED